MEKILAAAAKALDMETFGNTIDPKTLWAKTEPFRRVCYSSDLGWAFRLGARFACFHLYDPEAHFETIKDFVRYNYEEDERNDSYHSCMTQDAIFDMWGCLGDVTEYPSDDYRACLARIAEELPAERHEEALEYFAAGVVGGMVSQSENTAWAVLADLKKAAA